MQAQTIQLHNVRAAAIWDSGGSNYEQISASIADAIEHCVVRLEPKPGEQILDVATGTGWAARRVATRGARVTGIDIGCDLIDAARKNAAEARLDIDFQIADAEALPFENHSFDAAISTFGVMFVSKPETAAAELARICKKGGRVALATWPPDGTIAGLFRVMKPFMPTPALTPPPSPFEWGKKERLQQLLGAWFDLHFETGTTVLHEKNAESVWELFVSSYGPTRMLASTLDHLQLSRLKEDFISYHDGFKSELGIAMPRDYLVTVGIRR